MLSAAPSAAFNFAALLRAATLREVANERARSADARRGANASEAAIDDTCYNAPSDSPPESPFTTPPSSLPCSPLSSPPPSPCTLHPDLPAIAQPSVQTTPSARSAAAAGLAEKCYRREKGRKAKRRKKALLAGSSSQGTLAANAALVRRCISDIQDALQTSLVSAEMPHVRTGYQGPRIPRGPRKAHTLPDLLGPKFGFTRRRWDARYASTLCHTARTDARCSHSVPVRDREQHVIGVCVANPQNWGDINRCASGAIETARKRCFFPKKSKRHRRGDFLALAVGTSFGGGQKAPGNLELSTANREALDSLLADKAIQRIAGHGSRKSCGCPD